MTGEPPTPEQPSPDPIEQLQQTLAPLAQGAVAMHELYLSFTAAGFTEAQALTLVAELLKGKGA